MKKIRITIKREVTLDIEFDESKLDSEFIESWSKHITDLHEEPDGFYFTTVPEDIDEEVKPFFNLAEHVGYAVAVNQDDHIESLQFYPESYKGINPERDAETPIFYDIVDDDTEYEFDFGNCNYN